MISHEKLKILTPLQKMPKNVRDLDKLIVAKGFKKSNKSPNLVTLVVSSCLGEDRNIFGWSTSTLTNFQKRTRLRQGRQLQ